MMWFTKISYVVSCRWIEAGENDSGWLGGQIMNHWNRHLDCNCISRKKNTLQQAVYGEC